MQPTANRTGRAGKPRPLVLSPQDRPVHGGPTLSMDEVIELMSMVNGAVRAAQFTQQLAGNINRLCSQLKISGECLELSHKNELNKVFVSLRQACCRDSGALGAPCRLKIMELVELRAMGWRPSLSHSQYYLQRQPTNTAHTRQSHHNNSLPAHQSRLPANGAPSGNFVLTASTPSYEEQQRHTVQQAMQRQFMQMQQMAQLRSQIANGPAPGSAPPFGTVPINPFAMQGPPPMGMPPQMAISGDGQTSYYLIPASAGLPINGMAHHFPGSPLSGNMLNVETGNTMGEPMPSPLPDTPWPKGAVIKPSPKYPRPQPIPGKQQFRDEIVIRNADSGKIMGVKGRRVAVVEELSQTVISFQKAASNGKDRALTVTGNTEEQIMHAKLLIEETIRRNVSPNRPGDDDAFGEMPVTPMENLNIRFEKGDDGTLRMSCDDPDVLNAAQEALSQYFIRSTGTRRSGEMRQERRKSVPSFTAEDEEIAVNEPVERERKKSEADMNMNWRGAHTRSTPNLAAVGNEKRERVDDPNMDGNPQPLVRAVYTRDYVLKCSTNASSNTTPVQHDYMLAQAADIMLPEPTVFDIEKHKTSIMTNR